METLRRNSSVSSSIGVRGADIRKQAITGPCSFIRVVHGGR